MPFQRHMSHSPSTQVHRHPVHHVGDSITCGFEGEGWWFFFSLFIPFREDPVWPGCICHAWLFEWASAAEEAGFTRLPKVSLADIKYHCIVTKLEVTRTSMFHCDALKQQKLFCFLFILPRAVELLQSTSSKEELAFALGNYGRALR